MSFFKRRIMFFQKIKNYGKFSKKMQFYLWIDYFYNSSIIKQINRLKFSHFLIDNFKINQRIKNDVLNHIEKYKKERRKLIRIDKIVEINVKPINFEEELNDIYSKEFSAKINKIKLFFVKIYRMLNIKYLLDLKNSQDNISKFFHFLSENIKVYKKALEELVEGHREVTYHRDFTFKDGQTVQDKIDKV